jgi:hypothetical protein
MKTISEIEIEKQKLQERHRADQRESVKAALIFPLPTVEEIDSALQVALSMYTQTGSSRHLAEHVRSLMLAYNKGVRDWEGW